MLSGVTPRSTSAIAERRTPRAAFDYTDGSAEQEISLANNARVMFEQSEHALQRIVDRTYGICESCGNPIGKNRLLAFPRATLCMPCKSKQERR